MEENITKAVEPRPLDNPKKQSNLSKEEIRKSLPKNFCPLPFTHLFLYPTGDVYPCCESAYKIGNLKDSTIEELWNGERIQKLREEFIKGDIKICDEQTRFRQCQFSHEFLLPVTRPSKTQNTTVRSFDLMLNGQCNLECVMCPVWTLPNKVYDKSSFWSEGQETIFPMLKRISVKSGEPFIQKDTYRLMKEVSEVNKECIWEFTTNGNYRLTDSILDHLDRIRIDCLKVSVDSLQESVFPTIRGRGDLKKVLETLKGYIKYRDKRQKENRPFELGVNMAVQIKNWQEPPALIALSEELNFSPIFIYVYTPREESINNLPLEKRIEILDYYFDFLKKQYESHGEYRYVRNLRTIILPIMGIMPEDLRTTYQTTWLEMGGKL